MHGTVKVFRYETGEWDRYFKLVYLKKEDAGKEKTADSAEERIHPKGVEILRSVLERYRTLSLPREIPACVFKNDVVG